MPATFRPAAPRRLVLQIKFHCGGCAQEYFEARGAPGNQNLERLQDAMFKIVRYDIPDSGVIDAVCEAGHRSRMVLQEQKFEILFEIGAHTVVDGYYREAVTSFMASLEAYYDFFLRAALYEREWAVVAIDDFLKKVNRSENKLGAYIAAYTFCVGEVPVLLHPKWVEFRNKAVHKGTIPTREEVVEFGTAILDLVRQGIEVARASFPAGVQRTVAERWNKAVPNHTDWPGVEGGTAHFPHVHLSTLVSLVTSRQPTPETLEERLTWIQRLNDRWSEGQPT